MSYEVSLDALGTSYSIPEAGQTNYANDLSLYLRDLATVVNDASGGSLVTPVFNVRTYGATGNGSTDDTAAINLAKAALLASSSTGGTLYFPAGTYKTSSTLQFGVSAAQSGVRVVGDGPNSIIKPTGAFSTTPVIEFRDCNYWVVQDIKIDASARTGSGDNILVDGCSYGYCTNSTIVNATRYGVNVTQVSGVAASTYNVVNANVFSGNTTANTHVSGGVTAVGTVANNLTGIFPGSFDVDVKSRFGVAADGSTDDTAAIQAALDWGYTQINTYQTPVNLIFPPGTMKISSTLLWRGNSAAAPAIIGAACNGFDNLASAFAWYGAADGVMLFAQSANKGVLQNITLDGRDIAGVLCHLSATTYADPAVLAATSGIRVLRCVFRRCKPATSGNGCVALGTDTAFTGGNTYQQSEVVFRDCQFLGESASAGGFSWAGMQAYGIRTLSGGNCKNFAVYDCTFNVCETAINWDRASGNFIVTNFNGGNCKVAVRQSDGHLFIAGGDFESFDVNDFSFLIGSGGGGDCCADVSSMEAVGFQAGTVGTMITWGGSLLLRNCYFANQNSSVSGNPNIPNPFKMIVGGTAAAPGGVTSVGNWFVGASSYAPFYDGSANWLAPVAGSYGGITGLNVRSWSDKGGTNITTSPVPLGCFDSRPTTLFGPTFNGPMRFSYLTLGTQVQYTAQNPAIAPIDSTSGDVTLTLPTAVGVQGQVVWVSKSDSSANTVTCQGVVLRNQYETVKLVSNGTTWDPMTPIIPGVWPDGSAVYDIRDYGAIPGAAGKAATTAAFNAIFAAINWGYFPSTTGQRASVIYVPAIEGDSWYTDDLDEYVGNPGASIYMKGDMPSGRSGIEGSTLKFDGTAGTTWFKFLGINASTFENLTFDGNSKALVLTQISQKWYGPPDNTQVGSSGVRFNNCFWHSPQGDYDSILVQAGSDDDPPNTMQSSEYRFYNCQFQGHNAIQGWGFRAVVAGNTKNFTFDNCTFSYVYRGIEANSGYLICREVQGGNIGYDRDENAAMIYTGCLSVDITGGGIENGSNGYFARWLISTQGCHVNMSGSYIACTPPADDYVVVAGNSQIHMDACDFLATRTTASAIAWTALTPVLLGQQRLNDGGKWYVCTVAGTTGNTGGPTGTGSAIADGGTVEWDWVTSTEGNVAKLQLDGLLVTTAPGAMGSAVLENCSFPYITTAISAVPIYDGNSNPICPGLGGTFDYARSVRHLLYVRGIRTGLSGSDIDVALPDNNGVNIQNAHDQLWTDNLATTCTVLRNDTGVAIITVPFAAAVAAGVGTVRLSDPPAGYRFTEAIIDVTTLFAGPGVTGIEASLGTSTTAVDSLLLGASIEATGQIGMDVADRGTAWNGDRYIIPFGTSPSLNMKFTVSGGNIADINAGSLNLYLQFQRIKV